MDGTILGQGTFVATGTSSGNVTDQGNPVIIQIPSGADWLHVRNFTKWGANGNSAAVFNGVGNAFVGFDFYWQRGMAPGSAMLSYKANGAATVDADTILAGGFTLYDPSGQSGSNAAPLVGPTVATTASTNATRPVVSTGNTAGITVGTVVRMSNTAQTDVNGIDMVVGAVTVNTNFTLLTAASALATAPGAIGGAGFYRIVNVDSPFYPRKRYVTNITQAVNPTVSTSVAHGLTPGQAIRFNIPAVSGMTQLNPTSQNNYLYATVVSVTDDYDFVIDINTTGFTAFTWPTIAQQPSSFPEMHPAGENTAFSLTSNTNQVPSVGGIQIPNTNTGILADSTVNTLFLGMILGAGGNGTALTTPILGPSGSITTVGGVVTGDTMYWVAGKSTYGGL
jgi:hypothetical protein